MRKLLPLLLVVLTAGLMTSCKEEVVSKSDGRQTAVIYGLLNASEEFHFVRINRAIFGSGNALEIAAVPDSSYFDQVDATIQEIVNGTVTRTWDLKDTIIDNKEPGVFYYPEQKLYYFRTPVGTELIDDGKTIYRLEAKINGGEFSVIGETTLVSNMFINAPKESSQFNFANQDVSENGYANTTISVNTGNASKLEVSLTVSFEEFIGQDLFATKSFKWVIREFEGGDLNGTSVSTVANGKTFYELVKQNATNNPQITKRQLKSILISEYGADENLQKYMLVNKPSSSLTQSKPIYTNLTATNDMRVLGIFSSRGDYERLKPDWVQVGPTYYRCLNKNSTRELCSGTITGELLFCSDNPADQSESYFCN
ncbi:MAG: hypothetical protein EP338_08095 [Bacteroidetes bacterium]|nr:MAG: hypothetical protein EP338_08095 [Bacteroidota bacterium]